ncbi:hypothetical protein SEUCBS140593_000235 [Sporothrix eucalyptigena]|uniref:Carboxymuconolactone decarboxylase-like domain-containing protein n=1 Tax=Sporothrix eucalyptigena TaxID=1812306 RepID=A0ABP0AN03_9PEZI
MNRLGYRSPATFDKEAQEFYDVIHKYLMETYNGKVPRRNLAEDGTLGGPFATHLHTPRVGHHFHGLGSAVEAIPGLTPFQREIAILVTAAKYRSNYAVSAHLVKGPAVGFAKADIESIMDGTCPASLAEDGVAIYKAADHLVNRPGTLPQTLYDPLIRFFGTDGTKHLIHLVGFYSYMMVVLNGFDVKAPEDAPA